MILNACVLFARACVLGGLRARACDCVVFWVDWIDCLRFCGESFTVLSCIIV